MATERPSAPRAALEGVRVLDIATMAAAPWAAAYLAEFGADVIKVEAPVVGDHQRRWGTPKNGEGLSWKSMGRNKRSVTLSLSKARGAEIFKRLVADVDVVIENFRPGTLERWGIGYETLREINPRLVLLRVTGFGQTGPYRERPGFGTLAESLTGFASLNGHPDGPPTLPNMPLADGVAGVTGAFAVMLALYWRDAQGGSGQMIDLSLCEPLLRLIEPSLLDYDQFGIVRGRIGNRSDHVAPRNSYLCGDGKWLSISASAQSIFERLMDAIGRPELRTDPRFSVNSARVENVDELDGIIGAWILAYPREEALRLLEAAQVAAAPVQDIGEVFEDPQFLARQSIVELCDPTLGAIRMVNVAPRLSETPGEVRTTGPALGAHNAEIYGQLGISVDEQGALRMDGVI
ncbi:MAG TPA: CoA transferase [Ktedonobacterales bacterium]|jgi:crotonobetainyl-CoA:carnitine CoA-transferase CaiB-like acyl-CoA transferase|nr:CoA transferase [Ktedonobacterales bacterium]